MGVCRRKRAFSKKILAVTRALSGAGNANASASRPPGTKHSILLDSSDEENEAPGSNTGPLRPPLKRLQRRSHSHLNSPGDLSPAPLNHAQNPPANMDCDSPEPQLFVRSHARVADASKGMEVDAWQELDKREANPPAAPNLHQAIDLTCSPECLAAERRRTGNEEPPSFSQTGLLPNLRQLRARVAQASAHEFPIRCKVYGTVKTLLGLLQFRDDQGRHAYSLDSQIEDGSLVCNVRLAHGLLHGLLGAPSHHQSELKLLLGTLADSFCMHATLNLLCIVWTGMQTEQTFQAVAADRHDSKDDS